MNSKLNNIKKVKNIILYLLFAIVICILLYNKTGYMIDELLTYNLANAEEWFQPMDGVVYTPADQPFLNAMVSNGTFDLSHVWRQQENDTHPPFYYVLVHAVCTLFPGKLSVAYAGVINIVFAVLTLFFYRKILRVLIEDDDIVFALSVVFCFTAGILEIMPFLRMYVMSMFLVTAFSYLIIRNIELYKLREYLLILLVTVCGSLTHYYFIVYVIFSSLVLALVLFRHRRIKEIVCYGSTILLSELISYLIFPAMVKHLFLQGRGAESLDNMKSSYIDLQVKSYIDIINPRLFGGLLGFILIIIIFFTLLDLIYRGRLEDNNICGFRKVEMNRLLCLTLPCIMYILFVAKSAPYNIDRYVSPIYAVLIVSVWSLLYLSFKNVYSNKIVRNRIYSLFALIIVVISLTMSRWDYLYRGSAVRLANSKEYGSRAQAVVLYDAAWKINPHYMEIKNCVESLFYTVNSYQQFEESIDVSTLPSDVAFFVIGMDSESFINEFLDNHGEYKLLLDNGQHGYGHSYYLTK